tara:strand:+ start:395 stop:895 length:501 start_codon:yes stop_codon:yes gene_type:complete
MNYASDVNTLNPLIEHAPMRDNNINYGGLDYGHINSLSSNNKTQPVVRRIEPMNHVSHQNGISRELNVSTKQGSLEYSMRDSNIYNIFKDIADPKVDTYTIMEDTVTDDNEITYSLAPRVGDKNSAPFSTPSRNITILETPTRSGDTHPSILQNRQARMRTGVGKN